MSRNVGTVKENFIIVLIHTCSISNIRYHTLSIHQSHIHTHIHTYRHTHTGKHTHLHPKEIHTQKQNIIDMTYTSNTPRFTKISLKAPHIIELQ